MPWVRFTSDFAWKPIPAVTTKFRAGTVANVTTPCATAAIAKGRAEPFEKPARRKKEDDGNQG